MIYFFKTFVANLCSLGLNHLYIWNKKPLFQSKLLNSWNWHFLMQYGFLLKVFWINLARQLPLHDWKCIWKYDGHLLQLTNAETADIGLLHSFAIYLHVTSCLTKVISWISLKKHKNDHFSKRAKKQSTTKQDLMGWKVDFSLNSECKKTKFTARTWSLNPQSGKSLVS